MKWVDCAFADGARNKSAPKIASPNSFFFTSFSLQRHDFVLDRPL
jgi:hypothetical protein